jgi:hypothetical protein
LKNVLGCHSIQRRWKSNVHSHLDNDLDYLVARAADVERSVDMSFELRRGITRRRKSSHSSGPSGFRIQPWTAVNLPGQKLDDVFVCQNQGNASVDTSTFAVYLAAL